MTSTATLFLAFANAVAFSATGQPPLAPVIQILIDADRPPLAWAAGELAAAIRAADGTADVRSQPTQPGAVRRFEIRPAGDASGTTTEHTGAPRLPPEAYALAPVAGGLEGAYVDDTGGMYALLDLAERVEMQGLAALRLSQPEEHRPAVAYRGVNPFLSIPLADQEGNRDWEHWWFTDERFWRGYLDLLAKSRINWIDLHGMCDVQVTSFPNMWPYFVVSEKYPEVGLPPEQARKNLAMLGQVCRMAKERGIKLSIMNYTGGWNWPGCRTAPERPAEDFIAYTKEGLKRIVQGCPDLGMVGFRIGESGYGEDFYAKSYVAALEELGRPLPLYTRTWGADKGKLLELGRMYPDKFIIEIKYNAEHMGPPWHVAGGRMAGWHDYSYQDYLFYPRAYQVTWQIRANGTHRVFQWAGYAHIRACVQTTTLAGSAGFCVEPMSTYFPVTDFFHKQPLFHWEYERNPLWYLMWGRLAYDPNTPEEVFRLAARHHWGAQQGNTAYALLQSLSRIVPTIKTQFSLGPDHRLHAPELEWGGSIRQWAHAEPLDTYFAMSPLDFVREVASGPLTGRRTPLQAAALLDQYAAETDRLAAQLPDGGAPPLTDIKLDGCMTAALARYYAARLRAACAFARAEWLGQTEPQHGSDLRTLIAQSQAHWKELADLGDAHYRPFLDMLRMHTQTYLWSQATPSFARDASDLRTLFFSDVSLSSAPQPMRGDGENLAGRIWSDGVTPTGTKQRVALHATVIGLAVDEVIQQVNLLWKPFRSEAAWRRISMEASGAEWRSQVEVDPEGALYGLEVITTHNARILPVDGTRPYGAIEPWSVK